MMSQYAISPNDRHLLSLVVDAMFANPYTRQRELLDQKILGEKLPAQKAARRAAVYEEVSARVSAIIQERQSNIEKFGEQDQFLIRHVFLFVVYHRTVAQFDQHILDQIEKGQAVAEVSFGKDVLAQLLDFGFDTDHARRYLSFCFQVRRAFFFIESMLPGLSPCMESLRAAVWNLIFTHNNRLYEEHLWNRMSEFPVLIGGEIGSGREVLGQLLGKTGFIPYDPATGCFEISFEATFRGIKLSGFSEDELAHLLFDESTGLLQSCGPAQVLFLDDIESLSFGQQNRLLGVLNDRGMVHGMQGSAGKGVQGRILVGTSSSIPKLKESGVLRTDLYFCVSSDIVIMPPVRKRIAEDPREMKLLLSQVIRKVLGNVPDEILMMCLDVVRACLSEGYGWPGNFLEVEQFVRRVLLKREYKGEDVREKEAAFPGAIETQEMSAKDLIAHYCVHLYGHKGSYQEVAEITGLDWRTVKKHIGTTENEPSSLAI